MCFSQLQAFLIYCLLGNIYLVNQRESIWIFLLIRKSKHFSRNCRNKFSEYVTVLEIYEILKLEWTLHLNEKVNLKHLFQQFFYISFFFILKQTLVFFVLPWMPKMFHAESCILLDYLMDNILFTINDWLKIFIIL